jgi:hypothetical protein
MPVVASSGLVAEGTEECMAEVRWRTLPMSYLIRNLGRSGGNPPGHDESRNFVGWIGAVLGVHA